MALGPSDQPKLSGVSVSSDDGDDNMTLNQMIMMLMLKLTLITAHQVTSA